MEKHSINKLFINQQTNKFDNKLSHFIIFLKIIIIILFIINTNFNFKINIYLLKLLKRLYNNEIINNEVKLYYNNSFAIIRRNYSSNGLFGFYVAYLGCLNSYINNGYIPILDLSSFPNIFNSFNSSNSKENPWELFFRQPFGYKLENIKKYGKTLKYIICNNPKNRPGTNIYNNKSVLYFWRNIAKKYIPLKKEIVKESDNIMINLFKGSKNVLGVLIRGTDYLSMRPKGHPIQPSVKVVIDDVKKWSKKNDYDWIFMTTEDDLIRNKFILEIGEKLKYIKSKININYNYKKRKNLAFNSNIKGNINFIKIYLINIIIISKCLDIICSRTAGSVGAFIFSEGFRNIKVYYLGRYK